MESYSGRHLVHIYVKHIYVKHIYVHEHAHMHTFKKELTLK